MDLISVGQLDVVFISYDEPEADANWAALKLICPRARRVHGVMGLDRAHKAAARAARTERFVTVDGDTVVDGRLFDQVLDGRRLTPRTLFSWRSRNSVNGLTYGNGSVKCWSRAAVLSTNSHEAADDAECGVEFGRAFTRAVGAGVMGETRINGSAEQAFRSGLREAVKLSLVDGRPVGRVLANTLRRAPRQRLRIWCTVGADVEHGSWTIHGARLGCILANLEDWDFRQVNDYRALGRLWAERKRAGPDDWSSYVSTRQLGDRIRHELGLDLVELSPAQSRFFKDTQPEPGQAEPIPFALHHAASGSAADRLGVLHRRGVGVPFDPAESVRLFRLADELGNANGTNNLALAYRDGVGVAQDIGRCEALLEKAVAAGNPYAPYHLAQLLQDIGSAASDGERVAELLELAKARGFAVAATALGRLREQSGDCEGAAVAYQVAVENGDDEAEPLLRRVLGRLPANAFMGRDTPAPQQPDIPPPQA